MRRSPNLRSVGALACGALWGLSGIVGEGQQAPSNPLPTTLAYYQSLDASPWPDYQKLRNGLPWKYTIKFDVGPNRQQIGNLGSPSDPALGRFTVSRKGANLTYSIENDAGFPIFADFICSYSNGTGDNQNLHLVEAITGCSISDLHGINNGAAQNDQSLQLETRATFR
jgi:hypothetical protein